jgi:hypothetical protein
MSISNRTSRRRRIAFGLGATGGGLLAAAFMPMGIALAAPVTPDPGLFPTDTETSPDAFSDFFGVADGGSNPGVTLADLQLNDDNAALAAQLDYDIDNQEPFSFATLDGITPYSAGDVTTGPFEIADAGGAATSADLTNAASYDYAIDQLLPSSEVTYLDGIASGTNTTLGTVPTVVDNDPAADFVQIFDVHAFNPVTGAPTDALGTFAAEEDSFLNMFGLGGPLDQFEDLFTSGLVNPTTEALGGLGSTGTDLLSGLGGTGVDALTTGLTAFDPLSFLGL